MRLVIASVLLSVSLGFAMPNGGAAALSESTLEGRETLCGGYTRASDIFNVGDANKVLTDFPADNRTHVVFGDKCGGSGWQYTVSLVTLDDCQPIVKRYGEWLHSRSRTETWPGAWPTLDTVYWTPDNNGYDIYACPISTVQYGYWYDVYYNGTITSDFLKNVGFKSYAQPY